MKKQQHQYLDRPDAGRPGVSNWGECERENLPVDVSCNRVLRAGAHR